MRHATRKQQQQPSYVDEESFSDDDIDSEYSSEEAYAPVASASAASGGPSKGLKTLEDEAHMELRKPQTMYVAISISASPEQLAAGQNKAGKKLSTTWKFEDHVLDHLRENLAPKHRHLLNKEFLKGCVNRVIMNGFDIIQEGNSFAFDMDLAASHGLAPTTVSRNGASLWTTFAKTPVHTIKAAAFKPSSPIQQKLFEKFSVMTDSDLNADIHLQEATLAKDGKGTNPGYATIQKNSPAYQKLCYNIVHFPQLLPELEQMSREQVSDILRPARHVRAVEVPYKMGETVRDSYQKDISEFLERCVNFESLNFEIRRGDGVKNFNDPTGYVGEVVGTEVDEDDNNIASLARTTNQHYCIRALMSYKMVHKPEEAKK